MRPVWAFATAIAAVVLAVAIVIVVVRIARRRDSQAGVRLPEVVVALLALGAGVYFGVKAQEPVEKPASPTPEASSVVGWTASAPSSTKTTGSAKVSKDVVKIVNLADRPGVVDVTVRVSGPPSPGTQYLLVIHHNGGYQFKGKVASSIGEHVIEADVRLADPGSWRAFFVVGVDPGAVEAWEHTVPNSSVEMPVGSRELTQRVAHQMPA